ncbi:MAG: GTPase [Planctomycetota bacterium]
MGDPEDTIVAVSSCERPAPRAVVRLSGDHAEALVEKLFRPNAGIPLSRLGPYSTALGSLRLPDKSPACSTLPATLYVFRRPASYTREDVLELHIPGSLPLAQAVLDALLAAGARLALPGEFTRRAFENGRIDLPRAEAVLALVSARTRAQARDAVRELRGALSRALNDVSRELLDLLSLVELSIDFGDQDIPPLDERDLRRRVAGVSAAIQDVLSRAQDREILQGAVRVALAGRTNTGKSSLFNAILSHNRAIVHPGEGTTRDAIEAEIEIEGIPFVLIDLAGKRASPGELDRRAWDLARRVAASAHIQALVFDASAGFLQEDEDVLAHLDPASTVLVANKMDLVGVPACVARFPSAPCAAHVATSARTGLGVRELKQTLAELVRTGQRCADEPSFLLSSRQRQTLARVAAACRRLAPESGSRLGSVPFFPQEKQGTDPFLGAELVALELREAIDALTETTGAAVPDAVLDRIFARFCIGK